MLITLGGLISAADRGGSVQCAADSGTPLKLACARLSEHLKATHATGRITAARLQGVDSALGDEGYFIRSSSDTIAIEANTEMGLANGAYTLLRTLMIEDLKSPWDRTWNVREKPQLGWRSMMVAPYNFGGAHGFSVFSPDQWAFKHWKQYLDYLRLFNLNRVAIYPMRLYDPAIPETWPNKERYAIWKQAMDYAHDLGLKFGWVQTANHVHQETWWRNPALRNEHEGGWKGCALCYSKARDLIRRTQRHTFEQFKDADYFALMFSDGGGACYCDACSRDQAALFLQMVDDTRQTLREVGSKAEVVFWNWALDWWYQENTRNIPGFSARHPQIGQIQENVYRRLPQDVPFEDITAAPPFFGQHKIDTLRRAKELGFTRVIAFAYPMNPEAPTFAFPQPRLRQMIDMARYVRNARLDGIDGYRLAPHGRVLNDFAFMRLAWNPDLTREQLIDEMAGYLTENPDNRTKVAQAVVALDEFWEGIDPITNVDKAARLLDEAKVGEPSYQLEYTADMVSLLPGIQRLGQPGLAREEADKIKAAMFAQTEKRYILQGFGGTDYQWVPEATVYFGAFADMWKLSQSLFAPALQQPKKEKDVEKKR
jgi:hypothetical protein